MSDEAWKDLAVSSREALVLLGYGDAPRCFPGESEPCGGTFAGHTAANLAILTAVIDHHLDHLMPPKQMVRDLYDDARARLRGNCGRGPT